MPNEDNKIPVNALDATYWSLPYVRTTKSLELLASSEEGMIDIACALKRTRRLREYHAHVLSGNITLS